MKRWRWAGLALGFCFIGALAWAQGTAVAPVPGSVWTYLGPTFGASWVLPAPQPGGPSVIGNGGATDQTADVQNCLNTAALGGTGANNFVKTCTIIGTVKILGNVTIPANTTMKCGDGFADSGDSADVAKFNTLPRIMLDSGHTISAGGQSAWVQNCLIVRNGITFPAPNASAFAGLALSDAGFANFHVTDSVVLGFDSAIKMTGARPYIRHVHADGAGVTNAVIHLANGNSDTGHLTDIKVQPIASPNYPQPGATCAGSQRPGTGVRIAGINFVDGSITSQNFQTQQFELAGFVMGGNLWADNNGHLCGYGSTIGVKLSSGTLQAPVVNINGVNTGFVLDGPAGQNWIGNLFVNLVGQDCISAVQGFIRVDSFYTNNGNPGPTGNCGRYAIEVQAGAAGKDLYMNFGLMQVNQVNGNVAPYIHNSGGVGISLGRSLAIGELITNLAVGQNPYSGFRATSGSDLMMQQLPLALSGCTGLGTGSCSLFAGSDALQGIVNLSVVGTAPATGQFTLTFPVDNSAGRICGFTPSTNWAVPVTFAYVGTSVSTIQAIWTAASAPGAGAYGIAYRCSTF